MPSMKLVIVAKDAEGAGRCITYVQSLGMLKNFKASQQAMKDGTVEATIKGTLTVPSSKFLNLVNKCQQGSVASFEAE